MAKEIKSEIVINAKPERVWSVLTDFENYSTWNPFIKSIQGAVKVGNSIIVRIEPPGASGMTFKPKVVAFDSNKRFHWLGHLIVPGLFDGRHMFDLIDNGNGTTTFTQSEKFNGILVPLFKKMLEVNTLNGFKAMNEKMKGMAEEIKSL